MTTLYGTAPDEGISHGKNRLSVRLNGDKIFSGYQFGFNKAVFNTNKPIEVITPPKVSKYFMPFRFADKDFTNSGVFYDYSAKELGGN